jgi:hypothetical protein
MTQDELFDIALDSEARSDGAGTILLPRRSFSEERTGTALLQHELFQWMDELTL